MFYFIAGVFYFLQVPLQYPLSTTISLHSDLGPCNSQQSINFQFYHLFSVEHNQSLHPDPLCSWTSTSPAWPVSPVVKSRSYPLDKHFPCENDVGWFSTLVSSCRASTNFLGQTASKTCSILEAATPTLRKDIYSHMLRFSPELRLCQGRFIHFLSFIGPVLVWNLPLLPLSYPECKSIHLGP